MPPFKRLKINWNETKQGLKGVCIEGRVFNTYHLNDLLENSNNSKFIYSKKNLCVLPKNVILKIHSICNHLKAERSEMILKRKEQIFTQKILYTL